MQVEKIIEETDFELSKEYTVRPLEHKGLNKCFLNLVNADVFKPKKTCFWGLIKGLFVSSK